MVTCHTRVLGKSPGHARKRLVDDPLRRVRKLFTPMALNPGEGASAVLLLREHLAMSGDFFVVSSGVGWGCFWHLVGRGQGCWTSYNGQDSSPVPTFTL